MKPKTAKQINIEAGVEGIPRWEENKPIGITITGDGGIELLNIDFTTIREWGRKEGRKEVANWIEDSCRVYEGWVGDDMHLTRKQWHAKLKEWGIELDT